jgi:hypothetical protein
MDLVYLLGAVVMVAAMLGLVIGCDELGGRK